MEEKEPISEALRAGIIKLVTDGSPSAGGALTSDVLLRIMRVAKNGHDLLVSLAASPSNLAAMVKRPSNGLFSTVSSYNSDDSDDSGDSGQNSAVPYASSSMPENFGMSLLRELISASKMLNGNTSPAKLVEALAIAKEKGLTEVAQELEKQLGVSREIVPVKVVSEVEVKEAKEPEKEEAA